jgi:hypothetical protein
MIYNERERERDYTSIVPAGQYSITTNGFFACRFEFAVIYSIEFRVEVEFVCLVKKAYRRTT